MGVDARRLAGALGRTLAHLVVELLAALLGEDLELRLVGEEQADRPDGLADGVLLVALRLEVLLVLRERGLRRVIGRPAIHRVRERVRRLSCAP
jgi:hypothetical protein